MDRRTTTLVLAAVILVGLVAVALLAPMPYVILSPGPTANALGTYGGKPIITISGHKTYPTSGHLNMTTVSETRPDYHVTLPQVLQAWWSSKDIVIPRDVIYPPQQTITQVQQQTRTEMVDSQSSAMVAGLAAAGVHKLHVTVAGTLPKTPAHGVLKKGDQIVAVDGKPVDNSTDVANLIGPLKPGTKVSITVRRSGHRLAVSLTTARSPVDPSKSHVGVLLKDVPPFPVTFNPRIVATIGGPSAGLMFSLAIYDKLTPGPLTGGRFVAGTGTITPTGQVGPIGGVQQKIAGAYAAGARVFLVPAGDCDEAARSALANQVELVKVSTIQGAVAGLKAIDAGRDASVPRCS